MLLNNELEQMSIRSRNLENPFYLYSHIRPDTGEVFYVGQGNNLTTNKPMYYRANDKSGRNKYWKSIVAKNNSKYSIEIFYECATKDEINQKEIEFISKYGRKSFGGSLSNITIGGEGIVGREFTEEQLKILRERLQNNPPHLGFKHSENAKLKMSRSHIGITHSEETKRIIGSCSRGRKLKNPRTEAYKDAHRKKIIHISKEGVETMYNSLNECAKNIDCLVTTISNNLSGKSKITKHGTFKYII